jgi:hypothetical protein
MITLSCRAQLSYKGILGGGALRTCRQRAHTNVRTSVQDESFVIDHYLYVSNLDTEIPSPLGACRCRSSTAEFPIASLSMGRGRIALGAPNSRAGVCGARSCAGVRPECARPAFPRLARDDKIMRCRLATGHIRRVLCVFPAYSPAFVTFSHALRLVGARAFMPPQGLLLIASYLPESWPVRIVDENMTRAERADFDWADLVLVISTRVQDNPSRPLNDRKVQCGQFR